jgi:hypothetical protein
MFTGKTVFLGIAAVVVLFAGIFLVKSFSQISGQRTSGLGALVANLAEVLTSPLFWIAAVFLFFGVVFLTARLPAGRI